MAVMTQPEAIHKFLPIIQARGKRYKKFRDIMARLAVSGENVETRTADGLETKNTAKDGDYVVMNMTGAKEQYILPGVTLAKRYTLNPGTPESPDGTPDWKHYNPKGECTAVEFNPQTMNLPDPFYFIARWGEEMIVKAGDMICTPDSSEIYRIARKEFEETYRAV